VPVHRLRAEPPLERSASGGDPQFRRRLVVGGVWLVAAGAAAGLWRLAALFETRPSVPPAPALAKAPARPLAPHVRTDVGDAAPWVRAAGDGWQLVHQLSAHHVLVLEVETERTGEALAIARQLAEPVRAHYTEILVYVFRPGRRGGLPAARVQWTPRSGYEATWYR
jgi:hypothetical protein